MNFIEQYHRAVTAYYTPDEVARTLGMPIVSHPTPVSLTADTDTHHYFFDYYE